VRAHPTVDKELLVLSFATTHTLTDCLIAADAHAEAFGWGSAPVLLLLHDRPLTAAGSRQLREMRAAAFVLPRPAVAERTAGIPQVLQDLATNLNHGHAARPHPALDLGITADLIVDREPGTRLLAWAVRYEDVLPTSGGIHQIRRVDAVDTDGRAYQLSRLRGETHAVVIVDDQPDPDDTPATHPGLAALVAATAQLTHHIRSGDR
jgi:hypothetical protein